MFIAEVLRMVKTTLKIGDMSNPAMKLRVWKNGRLGFIKTGPGNVELIKDQQAKLTQCAKAAKGLKGMKFRETVTKCIKK